jgi:hypothetical protein
MKRAYGVVIIPVGISGGPEDDACVGVSGGTKEEEVERAS